MEDDELELGLALSLLEMKDYQLSPESQPQEISHTQLAEVVDIQETELHKSNVAKYVQRGDQMIEERCLNLTEKPRHSKNRRQRRKASRLQVVGLPGSLSAPPPVLLWFRRDLRLCDNPALIASLEYGAPVIPVFILSPEEEEGPGVTLAMGGASKFLEAPGIIL